MHEMEYDCSASKLTWTGVWCVQTARQACNLCLGIPAMQAGIFCPGARVLDQGQKAPASCIMTAYAPFADVLHARSYAGLSQTHTWSTNGQSIYEM